jgi:hypothetical protein
MNLLGESFVNKSKIIKNLFTKQSINKLTTVVKIPKKCKYFRKALGKIICISKIVRLSQLCCIKKNFQMRG